VRKLLLPVVDKIYQAAVQIDTGLLSLLGLRLVINGKTWTRDTEFLFPRGSVVMSNHQSWFDIMILQWLITYHGPMIKFLIKKQLIYVPIVGWICLALNFPRLNRDRDPASREADTQAIQSTAQDMQDHPGVLLIFTEGTRFTEQKRHQQSSPFIHLLNPKPGGMTILQEALPPETTVLDVSISYGNRARCSYWQHLSGLTKEVNLTISEHSFAEVQQMKDFLEQRWKIKDQWLDDQLNVTEPPA